MRDESRRHEDTPWDAPSRTTTLADLCAFEAEIDADGVPIEAPEAFRGVVELLDSEGRRGDILVRLNDRDPMDGMKLRPEYPRD